MRVKRVAATTSFSPAPRCRGIVQPHPRTSHGASGAGGVFRVSTDGSGCTVLKQGDFTDGGHFVTGVILSGTTLCGTSPYYAYGVLHSPEYRTRFANDLKKMLPRLPFTRETADFWQIGRAHV